MLYFLVCIIAFTHGYNNSMNQWEMTFEDRFHHFNLSKWKVYHDCSTYNGCSHNNEKQVYLKHQVFLEKHLILQATNQEYSSANAGRRLYRSGKIDTSNSFRQKYGRFEAKIKLPHGAGIWPAFWLMPYEGRCWPMDGEIDIMEYIGKTPDRIYGNYHFGEKCNQDLHDHGSTCGLTGASISVDHLKDDFHVYTIEWTSQSIKWMIDQVEYYQFPPRGCHDTTAFRMPTKPFYIILNLAVGGDWPGDPTPATQFPQRMEVEYVRVYRQRNFQVEDIHATC